MEGVHSPYIYLGNTHTWFAWHREDMNLYAVNHLLWGNDKIWYCIPPMKSKSIRLCKGTHMHIVVIQMIVIHLHINNITRPYTLLCYGVNVYFFRQNW